MVLVEGCAGSMVDVTFEQRSIGEIFDQAAGSAVTCSSFNVGNSFLRAPTSQIPESV